MLDILTEALRDIWRYLLQMLPCALAGGAVFAAILPLRQKRLARLGLVSSPWREGALLLFLLFAAGLAALTLFPANLWIYVMCPGLYPEGTSCFSFYPTATQVSEHLRAVASDLPGLFTPFPGGLRRHFHSYWSSFLFLGNVGIFLPIGFFPALLWRRPRWWKSGLIGFLASFTVEFIQLFIGRGTDADDLILNTLGALCGYLVFLLLRRRFPRFTSKFQCLERE